MVLTSLLVIIRAPWILWVSFNEDCFELVNRIKKNPFSHNEKKKTFAL